MDNPTPLNVNTTATRPDNDRGTVEFSRRGLDGTFEHRKIRVRYGGRSVLMILFSLATAVLLFLHKNNYAALTAIADAVVVSSIMDRYRRDLRWITGYDPSNSGKRK
jgi:hypothetical protein